MVPVLAFLIDAALVVVESVKAAITKVAEVKTDFIYLFIGVISLDNA
ncbi:hypothetical protein HMPREF0518_0753 [Lactobacillus helveticus DSM 20075 = CGMCC 1.1877]|nr:hypothetical protein HMPREF0518_0753 [Lactobacillus helveticus DSM 20075 = CGMCC 1.1877]